NNWLRWAAVRRLHGPWLARRAACTAQSTSTSDDCAKRAKVSPVEGSITGSKPPPSAPSCCPSIQLRHSMTASNAIVISANRALLEIILLKDLLLWTLDNVLCS